MKRIVVIISFYILSSFLLSAETNGIAYLIIDNTYIEEIKLSVIIEKDQKYPVIIGKEYNEYYDDFLENFRLEKTEDKNGYYYRIRYFSGREPYSEVLDKNKIFEVNGKINTIVIKEDITLFPEFMSADKIIINKGSVIIIRK